MRRAGWFWIAIFGVSLSASAQTRYATSFKSTDPFDANGAVMSSPQHVTVPGVLVLPAGQGPFPAVVISNSSAGTEDRVWERLLEDLPRRGYAAFGIQSFQARGLSGSVGSNQQAVSFQGPAVDALYALEYLRGRPEIDPTRICVTGHSRGGQTSFNFTYFRAFLELAQFKGDPFACNISINSGGHYRPPRNETTGRPALVILGEKDDVWHLDVVRSFIEELRAAGNPIETFTVARSFHSLTAEPIWCPQAQTARGCREMVVYTERGPTMKGKLINRREGWQLCGKYGYHCAYGAMELYPEMFDALARFLDRAIGPDRPR
jgi:dienelactone hydrolase